MNQKISNILLLYFLYFYLLKSEKLISNFIKTFLKVFINLNNNYNSSKSLFFTIFL